ncbi:hypothetical protein AAZX31_07G016200 [Glycine max]|nr:hypothetical protein GLYMA_07G017901v4 [Glycine max]KAH1084914.1 hypothetical protein GYH30_017117 [Glycine max]
MISFSTCSSNFNQLNNLSYLSFYGPFGSNETTKSGIISTFHQPWRSDSAATSSSSNQKPLWTPPAAGIIKCNLDAAIFNYSQSFGVGICIRGEHGKFIQCKMETFGGIPNLPRLKVGLFIELSNG